MLAAHADGVAGVAARGRGVLRGHRTGRFRIWPFLGPAFIACVAYIDPGNFATNVAGGSKFGYTLLWVIVASNLMAMLIQTLSAKLGIATGKNLPEVCRERFRRRTAIGLWLQAEVIAMATDLADFLGVCYLGEIFKAKPPLGTVAHHAVVPQFAGGESVLLAVGILGATVMPHVIYLHSALLQNRIRPETDEQARRLMRYTRVDVVIAMTIAGLINIAMLVMAASVFFKSGLVDVESLERAHETLRPILGGSASTLFALALLASGLSSSTVGTLSGQVVMQGFIRRQIPVVVRRLVTMLPALVVVGIGVDPSRTLVISQVVLSFGIPFALVPLVLFTSRRDVMGVLVNHRATTAAAAVVAGLISALNVFLIFQTFSSL